MVEPIRQRLDPIQHALIPAHVTLCREDELPDIRELRKRLDRIDQCSLTMEFGPPLELPDGCVLVYPATGNQEFQALRQRVLGNTARVAEAHLTLLHPRNATGAIHNLASIARELGRLSVTFRSIALIEQRGCDPWHIKHEW